jgi:acetoin utilization protein AcuB
MKPPAALRIRDVMSTDPTTIGPEDNLMEVLQTMRRHHCRRLPVVLDGRLIGIIAEGDVKRAEPSMLQTSQEEFDQLMELTTVSQIMIRDPITIGEDAPLVDAVRLLHDTKYGALPVLRDGRIVGIVTDNDLLRVFRELLEQGG